MNLLSLRYRKIAEAYIQKCMRFGHRVNFVESPSFWFFQKEGRLITFNLSFMHQLGHLTRSEAIHFYDCLIVCCLNVIDGVNDDVLYYRFKTALEVLNKPFKSKKARKFLYNYLAFTPKENWRNLEIADDLELSL